MQPPVKRYTACQRIVFSASLRMRTWEQWLCFTLSGCTERLHVSDQPHCGEAGVETFR